MPPRFDPELLQARWLLGSVAPEQLVSEALVALEQGYTGIALQQLAGLTRPTVSDLGTLPDRAFAEMGLKAINREQAVDLVSRRGPAPNDVMLSLLNSFPAFAARWRKHIEQWGGEPAGPYNDMAEFVHFVVEDL
jgi:hypothetical protein